MAINYDTRLQDLHRISLETLAIKEGILVNVYNPQGQESPYDDSDQNISYNVTPDYQITIYLPQVATNRFLSGDFLDPYYEEDIEFSLPADTTPILADSKIEYINVDNESLLYRVKASHKLSRGMNNKIYQKYQLIPIV